MAGPLAPGCNDLPVLAHLPLPTWLIFGDWSALCCRWQTPLCSLLTCLGLNVLFLTLNEGKNCFQGLGFYSFFFFCA